jgi:hypothetical protein
MRLEMKRCLNRRLSLQLPYYLMSKFEWIFDARVAIFRSLIGDRTMYDIIFLALGLGLFFIAALYARQCDRL